MSVCLVTGSAGLIGSEAVRWFSKKGMKIVGLDNDMRAHFFGADASTHWNQKRLQNELKEGYTHKCIDIRDQPTLEKLFQHYGTQIELTTTLPGCRIHFYVHQQSVRRRPQPPSTGGA